MKGVRVGVVGVEGGNQNFSFEVQNADRLRLNI